MTTQKIGLLIANLGTPDEPTTDAVKRYLKQFLNDARVIDLPKWRWQPLLNTIILPRRSPKVAKLYQAIWTENGSPLLAISRQQQQALQTYFDETEQNVIVELGMTYGNPSMASATDRLIRAGVSKIIILPLYPQYSSTTTASVFDAFAKGLLQQRGIVPFEFIHHYHDDPLYIQALAETINLQPEQWQMAFQSRFGNEEWLQPYTDITLEQYPAQGIKKVAVICPGFSADCLETLEEIAEENKENFINAGGESYRYIPALNANPAHIHALAKLVERYL